MASRAACAVAAAALLAGCVPGGGPSSPGSATASRPAGCNSPAAIAISIHNRSQDSPNDRLNLPC